MTHLEEQSLSSLNLVSQRSLSLWSVEATRSGLICSWDDRFLRSSVGRSGLGRKEDIVQGNESFRREEAKPRRRTTKEEPDFLE